MATLLTPAATAALPLGATGIAADAGACVSCGAPLGGEWCHACGERRCTPEQLSLRHSLREIGDDVFDLDSRAVRSARMLLFQPGALTLEFIRGRRRPYLGPLRMYLTVFAVMLFITLLVPQTSPPQSNRLVALLRQMVHGIAARRGMTDAATEKALRETMAQHVTWLSLLIPLVFAVFLFAFFRRRRRWFGEHLVFATHFGTFNFLVAIILIPFQLAAMRLAGPTVATVVAGMALFPMFAWMMVAVRRVYGAGWPGAVGWTLALFIAFSIAQTLTGTLALCTAALSILWLGA